MNSQIVRTQCIRVSVLALFFLLGACASNAEKEASDIDKIPSGNFEEQTAKVQTPRCGAGYMLTCEAARTGRIRFGKMKRDDLQSCSCEPEGNIPVNSPLPGIY